MGAVSWRLSIQTHLEWCLSSQDTSSCSSDEPAFQSSLSQGSWRSQILKRHCLRLSARCTFSRLLGAIFSCRDWSTVESPSLISKVLGSWWKQHLYSTWGSITTAFRWLSLLQRSSTLLGKSRKAEASAEELPGGWEGGTGCRCCNCIGRWPSCYGVESSGGSMDCQANCRICTSIFYAFHQSFKKLLLH